MIRNRTRLRTGVTLIESVVATSVLSLLIALLIPSVQSAREMARNANCRNNLRQIGLALNTYHSTFTVYPFYIRTYENPYDWDLYDKFKRGEFSAHVRLLPYLDHASTFNSINCHFDGYGKPHPSNKTIQKTHIGTFICPSDTIDFAGSGGNNYRGNVGVGPNWGPHIECPDSGGGFFDIMAGSLSAGSIHDGLSHTIAYSERLRGTGLKPSSHSLRDFADITKYPYAGWRTADFALGWCLVAANADGLRFTEGGASWFNERREFTSYTHAQSPNGIIPDGLDFGFPNSAGVVTARSTHPGGVNALNADGSIRFVKSSINRAIWRGLGTRNGGELVD